MGDTSALEILTVSADGNTIEGKTAVELGLDGGGGGASDEIISADESSKVQTVDAGTVEVTGDIEMLDAGSSIQLQQPDTTLKALGVDNKGRLTLPAKIIPADVTNPVHGEQRIKDGVIETYIQDQWKNMSPEQATYRSVDASSYQTLWPQRKSKLYWGGGTDLKSVMSGVALRNNNIAIRFGSSTLDDFWFRFQLPYPQRIYGVKITSNTNGYLGTADFEYQVSNDLVNWKRLHAARYLTGYSQYRLINPFEIEHDFAPSAAREECYRFMRIKHVRGVLDTGAYWGYMQLKTLGRSDAEPEYLPFNLNDRSLQTLTVSNTAIWDATNDDDTILLKDNGDQVALEWADNQAIGTETIEFDLGTVPSKLNGFMYSQNGSETHGVWLLDTYDGASWTTRITDLTLGGSPLQIIPFADKACYKWRLRGKVSPGNDTGTPSDIYIMAVAEQKPKYFEGDRVDYIKTSQSDLAIWNPSLNDMRNLLKVSDDTNDIYFSASAIAGEWFKFELDEAKEIYGFKMKQSGSSNHGVWDFQTSEDDVIWTSQISSFTLGGSTLQEETYIHVGAKVRYIRFLGISGNTANDSWIRNFDFLVL